MNYHQRMMNIPLGDLIADSGQYRNGHRDARHAAAEIANEADAEVERLREVMAGVRARLNPDYKPWAEWIARIDTALAGSTASTVTGATNE